MDRKVFSGAGVQRALQEALGGGGRVGGWLCKSQMERWARTVSAQGQSGWCGEKLSELGTGTGDLAAAWQGLQRHS